MDGPNSNSPSPEQRPKLQHAIAFVVAVAGMLFDPDSVVEVSLGTTIINRILAFLQQVHHHYVVEGLTRHDAVTGRGAPSIRNAGNILHREFIRIIFHLYITLLDGEKLVFAKRVTDLFLHQGRFVKKDEAGNWRDAPYEFSVKKTQTLLRDYTCEEQKPRRRAQQIVPVQQPIASVQQPILPVVQPSSRPVSPFALPLIEEEFLEEPLDDQSIVPVQQPIASVQQPILPVVQPSSRPVSPFALPLIEEEFLEEPLDDQSIVPVQQPIAPVQQPILPVEQPIARPASPLGDGDLSRLLEEHLDDPGMPDFIGLLVDMNM